MHSFSAFLFALLLLCNANAMIHKLHIDKNDDRKAILIGDFGFNENGQLIVNFKNKVEDQKISFVALQSKNSYTPPDYNSDNACSIDNPSYISAVKQLKITFEAVKGQAYIDDENRIPMDDTTDNYLPPGYYYFYVLKCDSGAQIDADFEWDAHNIMNDGKINYLPAGKIPLTKVALAFAFLWIAFSICWIILLLKGRKKVNRVHIFLACFLIFTTVSFFFEFGTYVVMGNEGGRKAMGFFFFFFTIIRGLLFFLIIVIIGTGLSFIKRHLRRRELILIVSVVVLQFFSNIAYTVYENRPKTDPKRTTWMAVFRIADLICCCFVVIPILWSLNVLRKKVNLNSDGEDLEQDQKSITKLRLFQRYYLLVIGFVYIRIIINYLISSYVSYTNEWLIDFVDELLSLGFYSFICYLFRPEAENPFIEFEHNEYVAPTLVEMEGGAEPSVQLESEPEPKQNNAILVGDDEIVIEE